MKFLIDWLYHLNEKFHPFSNTRLDGCLWCPIGWLLKIQYSITRLRIKRKQKRGEKLKVIFVIGDDCKWKCQKVYDAMLVSKEFNPYVAVTAMDIGFVPDGDHPKRVARAREFFEKKGVRVIEAASAETGETYPLVDFNPDIVIYQQPWGMARNQDPIAVCAKALTFYTPYYVTASGNQWTQHDAPLFKLLYGNFVEDETWIKYYKRNEKWWEPHCKDIACGSPMREEIAAGVDGTPVENAVIYAPHWSFPHPKNKGSTDFSMFLDVGPWILEYAKSHPEIHWIFKPHPLLRLRLIESGVWSKKKVDEYFSEWERIGEGYYSGDYLNLFYRSRAMITDCDSFISEYLILNRPIIHVEKKGLNRALPPAQLRFDILYHASDINDLARIFSDVIEKNMDPMKAQRTKTLEQIGYNSHTIANQFLSILKSV